MLNIKMHIQSKKNVKHQNETIHKSETSTESIADEFQGITSLQVMQLTI